MRTYHEQLLEQVMTERDRILSRQGLGVAARGPALSLVGSGAHQIRAGTPPGHKETRSRMMLRFSTTPERSSTLRKHSIAMVSAS